MADRHSAMQDVQTREPGTDYRLLRLLEQLTLQVWDRPAGKGAQEVAVVAPAAAFTVLLEGRIAWCCGGSTREVEAPARQAACLAAMLADPRDSQRLITGDARLRLVQLTATPAWLTHRCAEAAAAVPEVGGGLSDPSWTASARIAEIAQTLCTLALKEGYLWRLRLEQSALALVHEMLLGCGRRHLGDNRSRRRRLEQVSEVKTYLDRHLAQAVDLHCLGARFGMSTSTLQRYFKQATGLTVGEYLRLRRLELARDCLRRGQGGVHDAATLAGYGHTTNFITAYKKHFGLCPGAEAGLPDR